MMLKFNHIKSLRNLFLILFTACLPWMASAYKGPIDKPQAQSASHIHIQAAKNAVIVHFRMDAPGVAGITLKDARGRCIYFYAGYYPEPGLYTHVWESGPLSAGTLLFEVTHDGSRRETGQVVITPP